MAFANDQRAWAMKQLRGAMKKLGRLIKKLGIDTFVIGGSVVIISVYVAMVVYLWDQGLFKISDTAAGARILAAVLALLGGLFATLLTFAGVLLRRSLDQRAEERLKLETFIHAAGLLATDAAGKPAPKTQQAGALFALADLGQLEFALALLREMWPAGAVSPASACWLIDKCLRSNDGDLQDLAAEVLWENAQTLTTSAECFDWPRVILNSWPSDLAQNAGFDILRALFRCLRSRPVAAWHIICLTSAIVMLAEARGTAGSVGVRSDATLFLNVLLGQIPKKHSIFLSGGGRLDLAQLASDIDLEEAKGNASVQGLEMADQLKAWAKGTGA